MLNYAIALKWEIAESRLQAFKDFPNKSLKSDSFTAIHASNVHFHLVIYPNGNNDAKQGKTWIFLHLKLGNEKKVEAEFTLLIKSANWSRKQNYVFEKNVGRGSSCCTIYELLDLEGEFIVDGKLIVQIEGILKIENAETKCERKILKPKRKTKLMDLWESGFEDFTIVTDGKEIKVHKCVLACQSPVFSAMLKSGMKESIENKVEIPEFPFEIVEKAVQLFYQKICISDISFSEIYLLLKFFDKYDVSILKDNLEIYLGDKLTVLNICEIVKNTSDGNVLKLRNKCIDFVTDCVTRKKFVPNMELLDNAFMVTVFKNLTCHECQTI